MAFPQTILPLKVELLLGSTWTDISTYVYQRDGITINIFLLNGWSQSREDVQFAYKLAESTTGRVFFAAGKDLDRYVVWDYVKRRREILS